MYDAEIDRFKRDINLLEFAQRYGYQPVRRESSRASVSMRHPVNDDKIIVCRSNAGHWIYFSVRDERDNGTIVDFVKNRENKSLGQVRDDLRQWLGMPPPERPPAERLPELQPATRDRHAVMLGFASARTLPTSRYLNERALRQETLSDPKFIGTWKQDVRGNVLFAHRDEQGLVGYEIKNRGFTGFATGGTKALWQSVPAPNETILVVAESAIDAMSYHQLNRHFAEVARYASVAGAPSASQLELVGNALDRMPPASTLIAAVDADEGGNRIAQQLETVVATRPGAGFRRDSPDRAVGKDWNEVLQRFERDYVRALPPMPNTRARGPGLAR
jgi:hypothetical protein